MVDEESTIEQIPLDDFIRRLSLRRQRVMWLLGAGASANSGVPTASDMIWEFKQQLLISQRRVSPNIVADLTNPAIRQQLQGHIDSLGRMPKQDSRDEYATLFEATYPDEKDRRSYIEGKLRGASPSYGHMALASLMRDGVIPIVWTTNFDHLIDDAIARVYGTTGALTTITPDSPQLAADALNEDRWPIQIKLHGDFRSRRLKNTTDELRSQDAELRRVLIESLNRFGLVIVGYSGRDDSIMDALEESLKEGQPFPSGLFWLQRGSGAPNARVATLIRNATNRGIEAALVSIEQFDETLRDLTRIQDLGDTAVLEEFGQSRRTRTPARKPIGRQSWPVVRLNALPMQSYPKVCRRIVCDIGGYRDVRAAAKAASADLVVARKREGVLLFGSDDDVRKAFGPYQITEFDLHSIEERRLRRDSAERGLLREALTFALCRNLGMESVRKRSRDLLAPHDTSDTQWSSLKRMVGEIDGPVSGSDHLKWKEGIEVRLEWASDRLWLLLDPRIVFVGLDDENRQRAADFARERTVKRYNQKLNELLTFWSALVAHMGEPMSALSVESGVDAEFSICRTTAFSWRLTG